jgi:phosphoribosylaminoimidazole-succinocarboxamide synthase
MDTNKKYRNRHAELIRLAEVLKAQGIANIEELTLTLARTIQGYAAQLGIEHLRPRELEYVWLKLID